MENKRPICDLYWAMTPEPVKQYIRHLERSLNALMHRLQEVDKRVEKLEVQRKKNSTNSSKPPSSDSPFNKPKRRKKKSKRAKGGQKGNRGHQQQLMEPNQVHPLMPGQCNCGHTNFNGLPMTPFYTHPHIEMPEPKVDVTHWVLNKCGTCSRG